MSAVTMLATSTGVSPVVAATSDLSTAVQALPDQPAACLAHAVQLWQCGDRAAALNLLRQGHARFPADAALAANLTRAELGVGLIEPARRRAAALAMSPALAALPHEIEQTLLTMARPSALAGSFYAAQAPELAAQVQAMLAQGRAALRVLRQLPELCESDRQHPQHQQHRQDQPHLPQQQDQQRAQDRAVAASPEGAQPLPTACPKVLVLPHAGHRYSGSMAARGYALLEPYRKQIQRLILLGPAHRVALRGAALPGCGSFETPLGRVAIDTLAADALGDLPFVTTSAQAHAQEHCLEVHLPFVQMVWQQGGRQDVQDGWQEGVQEGAQPAAPRVLPVLIGGLAPQQTAQLLERLWGGSETLIVISTDLSHFHRYADAQQIDQATCASILAMRTDLHPQQACGAAPLNGLLHLAAHKGLSIHALGACNSGDTAGNSAEGRERVVGYASFALFERGQVAASGASAVGSTTDSSTELLAQSPAEIPADLGHYLLQLARHSLHQATQAAAVPPPDPVVPLALQQPGAAFVTLTQRPAAPLVPGAGDMPGKGALRGCIGSLQPRRSLYDDVVANAAAAALHDPRFQPVSAAEAPLLQLEVSVLGAARPLAFANESHALWQLRPGVDGVILQCEHQGQVFRSTFLPQVWSQLPDPRQFLAHLKRKAGLPADFWSPAMQLLIYQVQAFHEPLPAAQTTELAR